LTYTPDGDWNGDDAFTYTVDDQNGETDTANVDVIVEAEFPFKIYLPLIMR
ncbi:MAG: Ig-like domain-containing protein, partial [Anaerolineales bacterium]